MANFQKICRTMASGLSLVYSFIVRLMAYFAILAFLVAVSCVILKCIGEWRGRDAQEEENGENSPLLPRYYVSKVIKADYGACQQDIESVNNDNGSSSSSSSKNNHLKEIYDPKICVICYDQSRNCFFVPCGHCATCLNCAERIFYKENRICPVCRRFIGKIRRLPNSHDDG